MKRFALIMVALSALMLTAGAAMAEKQIKFLASSEANAVRRAQLAEEACHELGIAFVLAAWGSPFQRMP